jgi:hypothetical protein
MKDAYKKLFISLKLEDKSEYNKRKVTAEIGE